MPESPPGRCQLALQVGMAAKEGGACQDCLEMDLVSNRRGWRFTGQLKNSCQRMASSAMTSIVIFFCAD